MTPIRLLTPLCLGLLLAGCAIGPDYQRPALDAPAQFRHIDGWKPAEPADEVEQGAWWKHYGDAELDALVERLELDNQNLAAAEARFRQAQALVRSARAAFYPNLDVSAGATRSGSGGGTDTFVTNGNTISGGGSSRVSQSYNLGLSANWELDVWGRLRRGLEASRADFQASAADLAALRLSLQGELVRNVLQLRVLDRQAELLEQTVAAYERSLRLTENQYRAGIAPRSDVTQATTQLRNAQAQRIDLEWQRAQLEHAIAVLVGRSPAELQLAGDIQPPEVPAIPPQLPSSLLERRPDVAAAERRVMAANARIGVARAAYFPSLGLSASGGYRGSSFADWIDLPNRYWSVGPQLALTLFDGGARRADNERAIASYDETVASYRQTVLEGFREVEDALIQLQVLEREVEVQRQALEAARETLRLVENQYKAGMLDFLNVASAQATALSSERTLLNLEGNRLLASVQLITALGGGWQASRLQEEAR